MVTDLTEDELRQAYARCRLPQWGSFEDTMAHSIRRVAVIAVAKSRRKHAEKALKDAASYHAATPHAPQRKTPQIAPHTVDVKRLASGDRDDS